MLRLKKGENHDALVSMVAAMSSKKQNDEEERGEG